MQTPTAKRAYYLNHRAEIIARVSKYQRDHPRKVNAKNRAWRKANKTKADASRKKWDIANPGVMKTIRADYDRRHPVERRLRCINRRARIKSNGGRLSRGLVEKLMNLQNGKCPYCRTSIRVRNHLDHIVPLSKGGAHEDANMQLLCPKCNQTKSSKDPISFMQEKGFFL